MTLVLNLERDMSIPCDVNNYFARPYTRKVPQTGKAALYTTLLFHPQDLHFSTFFTSKQQTIVIYISQ